MGIISRQYGCYIMGLYVEYAGFAGIIPRMGKQMQKQVETDMDAGLTWGP